MAAASIPQGVVYPAGGSHGVMGSTDAGRLMIAASYKGTSPSLYDAALNGTQALAHLHTCLPSSFFPFSSTDTNTKPKHTSLQRKSGAKTTHT